MQSANQPKNHALANFAIPAVIIAAIIIAAILTGGALFTIKSCVPSGNQWDESELGDRPYNPHL